MSIPNLGYSCSKQFLDFPCCHRQWSHQGHCHFLHGYSRSFKFWFAAEKLDKFGFVVDFSDLKPLEKLLKKQFDHTCLINEDDPLMQDWKRLHELGALDLRIMKNVGMEFTAHLVWEWANKLLLERDRGRACCWRVEARENDCNSAMFELVPNWYGIDK